MKNTLQTQELILYCILCTMLYVISLFYFFGFWVLGLLCHHNASPSVTPENHTSGVQYEGSPQNPNRIERYSCNGSWDWRHTHTHINKPQRSKTKYTSMNTQNKWTFWSVYFEFFSCTNYIRNAQGVCSNREARKRPAWRHFRNSCHMFVCIVVCACSRHALDFKMLFFRCFVTTKGLLRGYFT